MGGAQEDANHSAKELDQLLDMLSRRVTPRPQAKSSIGSVKLKEFLRCRMNDLEVEEDKSGDMAALPLQWEGASLVDVPEHSRKNTGVF